MSDKELRKKVIRLAHQKPELRDHLLPLLSKKASGNSYSEWKRQWWVEIGNSIKPYITGQYRVVGDRLEFVYNGSKTHIYEEKGKIYLVGKNKEMLGTTDTSQDEIIQTIYMVYEW